MAKKVDGIFVSLKLGLAEWDKNIGDLKKSLKRTGREISGFGKDFTKGLTVPIAGIGAAAVKMGMDFNKGLANVGTLIPGQTKRLEELKAGVIGLSAASGKGLGDLTDGLYQTISALGDTKNTLKVLDLANKASIAGLATTADTINHLTNVTNGYGEVSEEAFNKASDLSFLAVKLGKTTFPELAASMGKVIPIANSLGVSQEELFASMSSGTVALGSTSEVVTQVKSAMAALLGPGKEMEALLSNLGFYGAKAGQNLVSKAGFVGALQAIVSEADKSDVSLKKVFGSVEALNFVTYAASKSGNAKFVEDLEKMKNAAGATAEAFDQQASGINKFGFELNRIWNESKIALTELGDAIINTIGDDALVALGALVGMGRDLIHWFQELSPAVKEFLVTFGLLSAAIGPVALGIGALITLLGGPFITTAALGAAAIAGIGAAAYVMRDQIKEGFDQAKAALTRYIDDFVRGLDFLVRYAKELGSQIGKAINPFGTGADISFAGGGRQIADRVLAQMAGEESAKKLKETNDLMYDLAMGIGEVNKKAEDAKPNLENLKEDLAGGNKGGGGSLSEGAEKAQKALKGLQDQLDQLRNTNATNEITEQLSASLDTLNADQYNDLIAKYAELVKQGTLEGLSDAAKEAGPEGQALAEVIAAETTAKEVEEWNTKRRQAIVDANKKASQEATAFWRNTFQNAITGKTFDVSDIGKQIAVGFVAELMAANTQNLFGGIFSKFLKGSQNPADFGAQIYNQGFTGVFGGSSTATSAANIGPVANGDQYAASLGNGGAGGIFGLSGGAATGILIGAYAFYSGIKNLNSKLEDQIQKTPQLYQDMAKETQIAFEEGAGQVFGGGLNERAHKGFFDKILYEADPLGRKLGWNGKVRDILRGPISGLQSIFGVFGSNDSGERMRKAFVNALNDFYEGGKGPKMFIDGQVQNFQFKKPGKNDFNEGGTGWDTLNSLDDAKKSIYLSLGEMLGSLFPGAKEFAGEGITGQFGAILANSSEGDLNKLQMALQASNLNAEQLQESLRLGFLDGDVSAKQYLSSLNAIGELFKQGIPGAIGDAKQAFDNFKKAATGREFVDSAGDIAAEWMEVAESLGYNKDSLKDLEQYLISQGESAQEVAQFMQQLNAIGITTVEQLQNIDEFQTASLVSGLEDTGFAFEDPIQKADDLKKALDELQGTIIETQVKVKAIIDPELQRVMNFADDGGGKVPSLPNDPTPTTTETNTRSLKLDNVKSQRSMNFHIDARGAAPGVENQILQAADAISQAVIENTLAAIGEAQSRGYFSGDF